MPILWGLLLSIATYLPALRMQLQFAFGPYRSQLLIWIRFVPLFYSFFHIWCVVNGAFGIDGNVMRIALTPSLTLGNFVSRESACRFWLTHDH
jgi:hypothetical protein